MKLLKALLLVLVLSHAAHAEGLTPFRTTTVKKLSKRAKPTAQHLVTPKTTGSIPTITFSTRLHTEGNVQVLLTVQKAVDWKSTISRNGREEADSSTSELYQGEVSIRGVRYPAAAAVVGKNIVLTFPGRERGSRGSRQRVFTLTTSVVSEGRTNVRVASSPSAIFHNKTCGHDHSKVGIKSHSTTIEPLNVGMKQAKLYHVLTLSTVADPELYAKYGKDTNAHIAGIVNAAEVIFERQLGIRFQIVQQRAYAEVGAMSIAETDAGRLLRAFSLQSENQSQRGINAALFDDNVDVKHLFTGKDLDGTTVGIAYIGAVCYQPKFAYSLTQVTNGGGAPYYFAHEIGHNLGARHDLTGFRTGGIMSPNIFVGSSFSQGSLDQINEHLLHFGSCLELKSMAPTLVNSTLTISAARTRRLVKFAGLLLSASQQPIAGATINLTVGKRVVTLTTNSLGRYVYASQRAQVKKAAVIFAATAGGEARSRSIKAVKL